VRLIVHMIARARVSSRLWLIGLPLCRSFRTHEKASERVSEWVGRRVGERGGGLRCVRECYYLMCRTVWPCNSDIVYLRAGAAGVRAVKGRPVNRAAC